MGKGAENDLLASFRKMSLTSAGLIAILALTFYLRLLFFAQYIDCDVGNAAYLAWRMAEGEVLIDHEGPGKPPLYSMLYALFIYFFGPSVLGLKIFGTLFILLAVIAVYWLANQAYGKNVGLVAALLFGVFSTGPMVEGGTVNLETVLHFPYVLAVGFFLKASLSERLRWYFLAGLCASLAMLVKQIGGVLFFVFLCYGINEIWRKKEPPLMKQWLYRFLLLGAGALLPILGVIIFYYFHGYPPNALYDSMVASNLRYIQRGHQLMSFFMAFYSRLTVILPENVLLWVGTLFAVIYLSWRIRRGKGEGSDRVLLGWAFWSFAALWVTGMFFQHYFLQIITPFSVLTGYGIVAFWRLAKSLSPLSRLVVRGVWTISIVMMAISFIKTDYKYLFSYTSEEQTVFQYQLLDSVFDEYGLYNVVQHEIASYVRAHTDPMDTIYVWGIAPQIYFLAQRKAATRYRNNYNMSRLVTATPLKALAAYVPMAMEEIRKSRPAYIVQIFRLEDFPELQTLVRDQYLTDIYAELSVPPYRVCLYRRR